MRLSKQLTCNVSVSHWFLNRLGVQCLPSGRRGSGHTSLIAVVCIIAITAVFWAAQSLDPEESPAEADSGFNSKRAAAAQTTRQTSAESGAALFPTIIRQPAGPPRIQTGTTDSHGNAISVGCSTCHTTRTPNVGSKVAADLTEFHTGMKFSHGNVSCLSCHNSTDYDALKLADGSRVEFTNVMTLCAQCHGSQMTDYEHGAHGGMSGFWDKTKGPGTKNNCVDCHNPHAPQFPKMRPTFKPKDRFLNDQKAEAAH